MKKVGDHNVFGLFLLLFFILLSSLVSLDLWREKITMINTLCYSHGYSVN